MQLSNHLVLLPSGSKVCIDLKHKKGCRINFVTGDFSQEFQAACIKINIWAFIDRQSLINNDESRAYLETETLPMIDFKYSTGLITIDRTFSVKHAYKLEILYQKPAKNNFPPEIELSYSVF